MDPTVKISVIIPAYNAADYILNALQSVYQQTEPVYEIIVIDDGSKDATFRIVTDYVERNNLHNLLVIQQKNGGPSRARNLGASLAKGNYLAFLDSDDIWLPEKIEVQKEYLLKYSEIAIISTEMNIQDNKIQDWKWMKFSNALWKNPFCTSSVIIKKEIFDLYKFDEKQKYSEDFKLYMDILKHFPSLLVRKKLFDYNSDSEIRQKSLSSQLWKMEKGELANFKYFYKKKYINFITYVCVSGFSFLKYTIRVVNNKFS